MINECLIPLLFNGELCNSSTFEISSTDRLLNYGQGCFETVLVQHHQPNFLKEHIYRALHTLTTLYQLTTSEDTSIKWVDLLISQVDHYCRKTIPSNSQDYRLKIIFWPHPISNCLTETQWMVYLTEYQKPMNHQRIGIHTDSDLFSLKLAEHKLIHYYPNILLKKMAVKAGYDDYLRLDMNGQVYETSLANIWFWFKDQLVTPKRNGLLSGIIRNQILKNTDLLSFSVKEKMIHLLDLDMVSSAWISNSLIGFVPICQLGERDLLINNEVTGQVNQLLRSF